MGQPTTANGKRKDTSCLWLGGIGLVLLLACWLVWMQIEQAPAYRNCRITSWYCDGQQELYGVEQQEEQIHLFGNTYTTVKPHLAYYLRYGAQWQVVKGWTYQSQFAADNGVLVMGPWGLARPPTEGYFIYQAGRIKLLSANQALADAASQAGIEATSLTFIDAAADASTGQVNLGMTYYDDAASESQQNPIKQTGFICKGLNVTFVDPADDPVACHPFPGGYAYVKYEELEKFALIVHLYSSSGEPASERVIHLPDPAWKSNPRIAGFTGGSVWLFYKNEQTAERRDLRSWRVLEQRDLSSGVHTIPRKLLRQIGNLGYSRGFAGEPLVAPAAAQVRPLQRLGGTSASPTESCRTIQWAASMYYHGTRELVQV